MRIKVGYREFTIGQVSTEIKTGKTPPSSQDVYYNNGTVNWFTPIDIGVTSFLSSSTKKVTEAAIDNKIVPIYKPNTILITCIGEIGRVGINSTFSSANQQITGVLVNEEVLSHKYFYYWLIRNKSLLTHYSNYAVIPILNNATLENIRIYLPSLEIQHKTVSQLDLIQSLIDDRKKSIDLLDDVLNSTFLTRIGDPIINAKGWEIKNLEDLISDDCNLSYGIVKANETQDGTPMVRPIDLRGGVEIDVSNLKKVEHEASKIYHRTLLQGSEILLCVRGNVGLVKEANILLKGGNVSRGIVPIRLSNKVSNGFLMSLFSSISMQKKLKSLTRGIGLQQLNVEDLRKLEIIVPDKNTIQEFETIYRAIFSIKKELETSQQLLNILFKSFLQDVFNEKEIVNEKELFEELVKTFVKKDFIDNLNRQSLLVEYLNNHKFKNWESYQIAKKNAFDLLEDNIIKQTLNKEKETIELQLSN